MDSIEYFLNGKRFTYRPVELIEAHAELCLMPDSEFEQPHVLARALHLACMLCYVLDTPTSECLSDVGVIHQLAHLIHLDEPSVELQEVRRAFADLLPADCVALMVSPVAGKSQHDMVLVEAALGVLERFYVLWDLFRFHYDGSVRRGALQSKTFGLVNQDRMLRIGDCHD